MRRILLFSWMFFSWIWFSCNSFHSNSENNIDNNNEINNNNNNISQEWEILSDALLLDSGKLEGREVYETALTYGEDGFLHAFVLAGSSLMKVYRFLSQDDGQTWEELPASDEISLSTAGRVQLKPVVDRAGRAIVGLDSQTFLVWRDYERVPYLIALEEENIKGGTGSEIYSFKLEKPGYYTLLGQFYVCEAEQCIYVPGIRRLKFQEFFDGTMKLHSCTVEEAYGHLNPSSVGIQMDDFLPYRNRAVFAAGRDGNSMLLHRNYISLKLFDENGSCASSQGTAFLYNQYAPFFYFTVQDGNRRWLPPQIVKSDFLKEFHLNHESDPFIQKITFDFWEYEWYEFALIDMQMDRDGNVFVLAGVFDERSPDPTTSRFPMLFRLDLSPNPTNVVHMDRVYTFHDPRVSFVKDREGRVGVTGLNASYFYDPAEARMRMAKEPCPLLTEPGVCADLQKGRNEVRAIRYRLHMLPELEASLQVSSARGQVPFQPKVRASLKMDGVPCDHVVEVYDDLYSGIRTEYHSRDYPDGVPLDYSTPGNRIQGIVLRPDVGNDRNASYPWHATSLYLEALAQPEAWKETVTEVKGAPVLMDDRYVYTRNKQDKNSFVYFYQFTDSALSLRHVYNYSAPTEYSSIWQIRPLQNGVGILAVDTMRESGELVFMDTRTDVPQVDRVFSFSRVADNKFCMGFDVNADILACLWPPYIQFFDPVTFESKGVVNLGFVGSVVEILENGYLLVPRDNDIVIVDPGEWVPGHSGPPSYIQLNENGFPGHTLGFSPALYGFVTRKGNRVLFAQGSTQYLWVDFTDPVHPEILEEFLLEGNDFYGASCWYSKQKIWCLLQEGDIVLYDAEQPGAVKTRIATFPWNNPYHVSGMVVSEPYAVLKEDRPTGEVDATDGFGFFSYRILKRLP